MKLRYASYNIKIMLYFLQFIDFSWMKYQFFLVFQNTITSRVFLMVKIQTKW
jgi:hypothetical protein